MVQVVALFRRISTVTIIVIVGSTVVYAGGSWYESYAAAERALANEDWSGAIREINDALQKKGDSSAKARTYGMNFVGYFPYLKLGTAYYHLGQLDAATQALDTEVRLGAIEQSEVDVAELARVRGLIEAAARAIEEQERSRIRKIVVDAAERARELEKQGRYEDAIRVLGEALAVAPDDTDANALMTRLRTRAAAEIEARNVDARVADLVEQGKARLADGHFEQAAATFDRALALKPSEEIEALNEDARRRLRDSLEAADDARQLRERISEALAETRALADSGDIEAALSSLQALLVADPSNAEGLALRQELIAAQADADRERSRREAVIEIETEVVSRFDARQYESALAAANGLLALDPQNRIARDYIARAYREVNARLLGRGVIENFPPAIRFADFRNTRLDDGLEVEKVSKPAFRLTGTIFDDSEVEVSFGLVALGSPSKVRAIAADIVPLEGRTSAQRVGGSTIHEFSVSHTLPPGLSIVRVAATDPDGLSSSSEYAVLYVKPFYRTPWFVAVLVAAGVVAALGAYGHRASRRRRLRRRQFNPYIVGAPVLDDNLFFGREELVQRIVQRIHNNSLLLFGERRIGKTSLQHHLKRRLEEIEDPDYEFYPAYIDLQGTPENQFFQTISRDVFDELAPVLGGLQPSEGPSDGSPYEYADLTRDLRRVLQVLRRHDSKKVKLVLLIDEVDELNAYNPRINQKLRSLFMKSFSNQIVAVVSGVSIKRQWESEGSPWYNFFEEIEVPPLTRNKAEALIRQPIGEVFKFEPGAVDRIVELSDCKPYLVQKICVELVERLHKEGRRKVTLADVDAVGRPMEV